MNKLQLNIKGFKCFNNETFELNRISLLTGSNASGKSSVIQALLLLKYASESSSSSMELNLNEPRYAFDFGYPDSLINNEYQLDEVSLAIADGLVLYFRGDEQKSERKLFAHVNLLVNSKDFISKGFTYFCAERQGPRYEYAIKTSDEYGCGCHGENTGNVMSDNWNKKIPGNRHISPTSDKQMFPIVLDEWINYIFPGISVRVLQVGSHYYQVIVRDKNHNVSTGSTNIGFGISYALPIFVGALLADDGSWLVIENPEAHLHAKAQSNMGYFLGIMASAGLRVVVETHSEHIVNGVRRAAVISGRLRSEDINIYFFTGKSESELITIDEFGNLSDFPVDFFDQSRQDMLEIINKSRERWDK